MLSLSDHLKPWSELNIACIDFETTGPDPKTCEPVELAVVRFEGGEVVSRYSTLIEPDAAIPPEATAIHGITDEMVRERGTAASMAWADAQHLLRGAIPCAYHAPFGSTILHRIMVDALDGQAVARWLELETAWPWLDPLVWVRQLDRFVAGKGRHTLSAACARRGIVLEGAHRAAADAEAAGRLLFHPSLRALGGSSTISEVLRRQSATAADQQADFERWRASQPVQP